MDVYKIIFLVEKTLQKVDITAKVSENRKFELYVPVTKLRF